MIKKLFKSAIDFMKEVKLELSKVTYPSKNETIGSTTVVIVFTLIVALFLAIVDTVLIRILRLVV
ncbi:MAG: preprotein translocase subunit SecE [Nitrospira sp.]|nr:preprotein translocase subunit SecE [Candidatus Manganitrophaceae bacterium]HIL35143.1 preprotein translocase subunit SecE [Candidatus Manganitrophaceae bacterium]